VEPRGIHRWATARSVFRTGAPAQSCFCCVWFGSAYALELTAQDVDHKLMPCTGSATFDIHSAEIVPVPVHLTCHEIPAAEVHPVPIPPWAGISLAALLLALGVVAVRRRDRI
jgi:hypothetical protein